MKRRFLVLLSCAMAGACGGHTATALPAESRAPVFRRPVVYDSTAPLGDITNPVRGNGPDGEHEYLNRLRCADGTAPAFDRRGSILNGGDTHILDEYVITCPGGVKMEVFMDMFHDVRERRPVGSLKVLSELPARSATGCPPQVGPTTDSSARYVFNYLEVETPAEALNLAKGPVKAGIAGYASVTFVVDTAGKAEPSSIVHGEYEEPKLQEAAKTVVLGLRFRPAEHHAACRVRQSVDLELQLQ